MSGPCPRPPEHALPDVRIHYVRPPDREQHLVQRLVYEDTGVVISLLESAAIARPIVIGGEVVVEPGAPLLWFTFPGAWFDVGRFHRRDGTFTGLYADILEPLVPVAPREWRAVDLFLDLWLDARGGAPVLLDEDELDEALELGWITPETGAAARREAERLLALAATGAWPPAVVREWTLARALRALAENTE